MKYLRIVHYLKVLMSEGTAWEYRELLSNVKLDRGTIRKYNWTKRAILGAIVLCIFYFVPKGFNEAFLGYIIASLSIFIGLFTNLIIVLYQRFSTIPKTNDTVIITDSEDIKNKLTKNFIKQFTFVTGKNLLISTLLIILMSFCLLSNALATYEVFSVVPVKSFNKIDADALYTFFIAFGAFTLRFFIIYLLVDFSLLLLYSLGSLFSFLKGEYGQ